MQRCQKLLLLLDGLQLIHCARKENQYEKISNMLFCKTIYDAEMNEISDCLPKLPHFFVIFNKFFAFFIILTAFPLLNYSITNLHNSLKRAQQKEFFFISHCIYTDLSCAAKKVEWHRVMIHHHLFMKNSHRTFE
jgi:hypothetical protein